MDDLRSFTEMLNDGDYGVDTNFFETVQGEAMESPILDSTPSSKPNQKTKGKNFNVEEDQLLVSAWVNVSTDATQGTNQTKAAFWTRVYLYYQKHRDDLAERSQNSLLHRWGAIQDAISKFCGYLTNIEDANQSGLTIHDKVEKAEKMFKAIDRHKKTFVFRHCWLPLRNQPKWHEKLQQLAALKASNKKRKVTKDPSPSPGANQTANGDSNSQEENGVATPKDIPPATDAPKRPIGKKKAKEALCNGGNDACIQALDVLWAKKKESDEAKEMKKEERYAKTYALDQERLQLEQKKSANEEKRLANEDRRLANEERRLANEANNLEANKLADEERIIGMDINSMNEFQKEYYRSKQAEIMARRMNNSY